MTVRVGINGFGRIGRCVARLSVENPDVELVAINDILDDRENLAYLYNYDSTYGRASVVAKSEGQAFDIGGTRVSTYSHNRIDDVPWEDDRVDVVIDSSGVRSNVAGCQTLTRERRVPKAVVTHLPDGDIDRCLIMGVNEKDYDPSVDHVVSSGICDANAIAHVLMLLDREYGIQSGFVTTLHPWLAYQNLVDRALASQSRPGHFWRDYSLGRASPGTLIPKNTTALSALSSVMGDIVGRLKSFSYRVPTQVVASADLSLRLRKAPTQEELMNLFDETVVGSPYLATNRESLTAVDYVATPWSAVVDMQWVDVCDDLAKVVLWYDNEWGYSNRVLDVAQHIAA